MIGWISHGHAEAAGRPGRGWPAALFAPGGDGAAHAAPPAGNILIVEDDHLVAIAIEEALAEAGFNVVGIAATADEAVAMGRTLQPDLAIMDVRLAGRRDGIDAALELHREAGIRCIFATAHHDAETRQRAQPAQPVAWLAKPYQPEALVRAVRAALSGAGRD